ncbi:MAG: SdpI family protein [Lachnospiraceae bacterium]|nr:SdpI family protein [Lachnospiraceae bacterium]
MEKKIKQIILNRGQNLLRILVILIPMAAGIFLWDRLPDQIATHFGIGGEADGWSSRGFTVFGIPLILLVLQLFCAAATLADPKREKINEKMMNIVLWIIPATSIMVGVMIYTHALGYPVDIEKICLFYVGILFIVIGNYMPKCRQNYTAGIKVPWTLASEDNWNHTHRMAGWTYVLGGIAVILISFIKMASLVLLLPIILIVALLPILYSFLYYLKENREKKETD